MINRIPRMHHYLTHDLWVEGEIVIVAWAFTGHLPPSRASAIRQKGFSQQCRMARSDRNQNGNHFETSVATASRLFSISFLMEEEDGQ